MMPESLNCDRIRVGNIIMFTELKVFPDERPWKEEAKEAKSKGSFCNERGGRSQQEETPKRYKQTLSISLTKRKSGVLKRGGVGMIYWVCYQPAKGEISVGMGKWDVTRGSPSDFKEKGEKGSQENEVKC